MGTPIISPNFAGYSRKMEPGDEKLVLHMAQNSEEARTVPLTDSLKCASCFRETCLDIGDQISQRNVDTSSLALSMSVVPSQRAANVSETGGGAITMLRSCSSSCAVVSSSMENLSFARANIAGVDLRSILS
jgi:hypothetical protein